MVGEGIDTTTVVAHGHVVPCDVDPAHAPGLQTERINVGNEAENVTDVGPAQDLLLYPATLPRVNQTIRGINARRTRRGSEAEVEIERSERRRRKKRR